MTALSRAFDTPKKIAYWIIAILVILSAFFLTLNRFAPSTDDATVDAAITVITLPFPGIVTQVYVQPNQTVAAHAPLFEIQSSLNAISKPYVVKAPSSGYITDTSLLPGTLLTAHAPAVTMIDNTTWWINATISENQLARLHTGQTVLVSVNTQPGTIAYGTVESIGWGAIAQLPPPANALPIIAKSNGWITLAQRFPVRIALHDTTTLQPLRVGSTAIITIYTNDDPVIHGLAYGVQWIKTKAQRFY